MSPNEFDFINTLCDSIKKYCDQKEKDKPKYFYYKQANFKVAYQKHLYVKYLENKKMMDLYTAGKVNKLPLVFFSKDIVLKDLALFVTGTKKLWFSPSLNISIIFLNQLKKIARIYFGIKYFSLKKTKLKSNSVLFYIGHERFFTFLNPITEKLKSEPNYFTIFNSVRKYADKKGIDISLLAPSFEEKNSANSEISLAFLDEIYSMVYEFLKINKPKTVIMIEGNGPEQEAINQACKQLSIKTVCIQHGWSPIVHIGFHDMTFSKLLVWGDGFKKIFQKYNPKQKIIVVGNHNIQVKKKTDIKRLNKLIFFIQTETRLLPQKSYLQICELAMWSAKNFPKLNIVIRRHPRFEIDETVVIQLQKYPNITFMSPDKYSLTEVFNGAIASVSIYSTTILESIAAGIMPIILNITSMPSYYPDISVYNAGIEVKDLESAKKSIKKVMSEKRYLNSFNKGMKEFNSEFFADYDAVKKIVKEIE